MNYFSSKHKETVLEEPPIVVGLSKNERFAILGIVALNLPFDDLSYPRGRLALQPKPTSINFIV